MQNKEITHHILHDLFDTPKPLIFRVHKEISLGCTTHLLIIYLIIFLKIPAFNRLTLDHGGALRLGVLWTLHSKVNQRSHACGFLAVERLILSAGR